MTSYETELFSPSTERTTTLSRRAFLTSAAGAGIVFHSTFNESLASSESNLNIGNFKVDFDTNAEKQVERVEANIRKAEKISPTALQTIMQETGTKTSHLSHGNKSAPVFTEGESEIPQFVLTKPGNSKESLPNMCVDRYPNTQQGGAYVTLQGLYLGRVSRPIETSIGTLLAEIGFSYRWIGGDNKKDFTKIIEPSWLTWRKPDGSFSCFASEVINTKGHFESPQNQSGSGASNGTKLVKNLDSGIGTTASQFVVGDPFPAQDYTAKAIQAGYPPEFHTYDAFSADLASANNHYEVYKEVTLAQAYKDGYVLNSSNGEIYTEKNIADVYPGIPNLDINQRLSTLPNYKEFLTPEPISLDHLLSLLVVKTAAKSSFIK